MQMQKGAGTSRNYTRCYGWKQDWMLYSQKKKKSMRTYRKKNYRVLLCRWQYFIYLLVSGNGENYYKYLGKIMLKDFRFELNKICSVGF